MPTRAPGQPGPQEPAKSKRPCGPDIRHGLSPPRSTRTPPFILPAYYSQTCIMSQGLAVTTWDNPDIHLELAGVPRPARISLKPDNSI